MKKALDVREKGNGVVNPGLARVKGAALKKKTGESKMRKTHVSESYCPDCGEKTSRHVESSSGHNHYDHHSGMPVSG